jgi:hypothetical protein
MADLRRVKFYRDQEDRMRSLTSQGWLIQFSLDSENGFQYPAAIIETDNGKIVSVFVELVQFVEPYKPDANS